MNTVSTTGSPGWSLVLLRESAILTTTTCPTAREPHGAVRSPSMRILRRPYAPPPGLLEAERGLGFAFPMTSLYYLLSLLANVQRTAEYADQVARERAETGAWSPPQLHQGMIRIYGPVIADCSREPWVPAASVELEYFTLADLHSNLGTVATPGPLLPVPPGRTTVDGTPPISVLTVAGANDYRHELARERTRSAMARYEDTRRRVLAATKRSRTLVEVSVRLQAQARTLRHH